MSIVLVLTLMAKRRCRCADPWARHRLGFLWEGPPYSGPWHRAVAQRWEQAA